MNKPTHASTSSNNNNDHLDDGVVDEIIGYMTGPSPRSFFLFAGAGAGKTHTLKEVLIRLSGRFEKCQVGKTKAETLLFEGRQLAVITYTNNAAQEIQRRLEANPLVVVSTIHSFCWRLIDGFNTDIRDTLIAETDKEIEAKENEKPAKTTQSGRARTTQTLDRMLNKWTTKLDKLKKRKLELESIATFTYSPDQNRLGAGALNHAQVIKVAVSLLKNKPTLRHILVDQHPIIFIDESQDTNKKILEELLDLEQNSALLMGLIGDHRQRIYQDGEKTLPKVIPKSWARPVLRLNRRCPHRVVNLINQIWMADIDGRTEKPVGGKQFALTTRAQGAVHLYLGSSNLENKPSAEKQCAEDMARRLGAAEWTNHRDGYKLLVLEHQLAAERGGFAELYRCLNRLDSNRAKDGTIGLLKVFQNVFLPLSGSDGSYNAWQEREIMTRYAVELDTNHLASLNAAEQREAFRKVSQTADRLRDQWTNGDPRLFDLLKVARNQKLLAIDRQLVEAMDTELTREPLTAKTSKSQVCARLLQRPWSEFLSYCQYIDGLAAHGTHQGVKGSEFERVLVVIDDEAAGGNLFAYEKLFGAKNLSDRDRQNAEEGKEISIDRTLRLLYVTCSRAKESLAVVIWTSSRSAVKEHCIQRDWFRESEISLIPGDI